jgi:hypothetical protein
MSSNGTTSEIDRASTEVQRGIRVARQTKKKDETSCRECMAAIGGVCTIGLLTLGIAAGIVAYIVFAIIALVNNPDRMIRERCDGSNLWAYVLTVLVVGLVMGRAAKNQSDEDTAVKMCASIIQLCLSTALGVWGAVEVWGSPCAEKKLSSLLIYKMAEIMASLTLTVGGLSIFIIICLVVVACYATDRVPSMSRGAAENERVDTLIAQMEAQNCITTTVSTTGKTTGGAPSLSVSDNDVAKLVPVLNAVSGGIDV